MTSPSSYNQLKTHRVGPLSSPSEASHPLGTRLRTPYPSSNGQSTTPYLEKPVYHLVLVSWSCSVSFPTPCIVHETTTISNLRLLSLPFPSFQSILQYPVQNYGNMYDTKEGFIPILSSHSGVVICCDCCSYWM